MKRYGIWMFVVLTSIFILVMFAANVYADGEFAVSIYPSYDQHNVPMVDRIFFREDKTDIEVMISEFQLFVYRNGQNDKVINFPRGTRLLGLVNMLEDGKFWLVSYSIPDNGAKSYFNFCIYQYKKGVLYKKACKPHYDNGSDERYVVRRTHIVGFPTLISINPARTAVRKVTVYALFSGQYGGPLMFAEYDEKNNSISVVSDYGEGFSIDGFNYILNNDKVYFLTVHYGKLAWGYLNFGKINLHDYKYINIDCKDADLELVGGNRAYITCVNRFYKVKVLDVDLQTGEYSEIGNFSLSTGEHGKIMGMVSTIKYVLAVVLDDKGRTNMLMWKKDQPQDVHIFKSTSLNFNIVDEFQIEHSAQVYDESFKLSTNKGIGVLVKPYSEIPPVSFQVLSLSSYKKDNQGCIYVLNGKLPIRLLYDFWGRREIYALHTGTFYAKTLLTSYTSVGTNKYDVVELNWKSKNSYNWDKFKLMFRSYPYKMWYEIVNGESIESSLVREDVSSVCIRNLKLNVPTMVPLSTSTYNGEVALSIKTTIPIDHKILIYEKGKKDVLLLSRKVGGKETFTATILLDGFGEHQLYVYAVASSGPYTVNSRNSNPITVVYNNPYNLIDITFEPKTYLRDYQFNVNLITDGELIVIVDDGEEKRYKVKKGENIITVSLPSSGIHTLKVKMCGNLGCGDVKTFTVDVYDHIEMWIGRRTYQLNGKNATMDTAPFIDPAVSRTVVPLRFILEGLGFDVMWNGGSRTIMISGKVSTGERTVILHMPKSSPQQRGAYTVYPGDKYVVIKDSGKSPQKIDMSTYNGQNMGIPFIYKGRTFVPVRFISEIFEAKVFWDSKERKVTIQR